jgi:hypothetical protein
MYTVHLYTLGKIREGKLIAARVISHCKVTHYQQTFCQRPLTCMYSQLDAPKGGNSRDGKGFKSIVGRDGNGSKPTDGKSRTSSHTSIY